MPYLLVAAGGAIGAVLRYVLMSLIGSRDMFGMHMNYGTLFVNIFGSFIMGMLIAYLGRHAGGVQNAHLFFAVGMLGSFTTFSTFSLDVITMMQRGEIASMAVYIILSVTISILALFFGLKFMGIFI